MHLNRSTFSTSSWQQSMTDQNHHIHHNKLLLAKSLPDRPQTEYNNKSLSIQEVLPLDNEEEPDGLIFDDAVM